MDIAKPNANVVSTLKVGKIKFQINMVNSGPLRAGLLKTSWKFFQPTVARKPGLIVFPSLVVNVPSLLKYISPLD